MHKDSSQWRLYINSTERLRQEQMKRPQFDFAFVIDPKKQKAHNLWPEYKSGNAFAFGGNHIVSTGGKKRAYS